jgi:hypothetical protein
MQSKRKKFAILNRMQRIYPHSILFYTDKSEVQKKRKETLAMEWESNWRAKPIHKHVQRHNQSPHMSQARSGETERVISPNARGTQSLPACTMSLLVLLLIFCSRSSIMRNIKIMTMKQGSSVGTCSWRHEHSRYPRWSNGHVSLLDIEQNQNRRQRIFRYFICSWIIQKHVGETSFFPSFMPGN